MKYVVSDLILFLAQFGANVHDGPAILPAFNNYYQDISGGQSTLGNLTLLNEERMFMPGEPEPEYLDFIFEWYIDDTLITNTPNPTLEELNPGYQGVMLIRLDITHLPTGVRYQREEFAYLGFNGEPPNPNISSEYPSQFGVFYEFYPEVDVYDEYAYFLYDFNRDGSVGSDDLLTFLANYGNN